MFQFSTAHWCERRIGAASGQAGPEVWPSRTHVQNGKRLAAYGDLASSETPERPTVGVSRADKARVFDEQLRLLKQEAMCDIR